MSMSTEHRFITAFSSNRWPLCHQEPLRAAHLFIDLTAPSTTLSPISQQELTPTLQSSPLEKHPKPAQDRSMSPSHKLMHTSHRSMGCDDLQPLTQPAMNVRKQPS